MQKVRLKLMSTTNGNEHALRTESVEGYCIELPTAGERFTVISRPLDPWYQARVVTTSIVQSVDYPPDGYESMVYFTTENSVYELEVIAQKVDKVAEGNLS